MNSFQIKESIDQLIYIGFNLISSFMYRFSFKAKRIIKRNALYANKHVGERCFVIGCGPSLKKLNEEQLKFLKNETVFGVNELFRTPFLKDIIPKYYLLLDNEYWGKQLNVTKDAFETYQGKPTVFISSFSAYNKFSSLNEYNVEILYQYARLYPVNTVRNDMGSNQTITMNVVTSAIKIAMYMGFSEIYLLGCDYTAFATPLDTHCYDGDTSPYKTNNLGFFLKYYEIATQVHYMVAKKAKHDNVSVVNLTEGSLLDAYPRKSFDEIIQQQ